MKHVAIGLIKFYQKTLSLPLVPLCKYHPSCSQYTIMAIEKNGIIQGLFRGLLRIIRCNPFSSGGIDLP